MADLANIAAAAAAGYSEVVTLRNDGKYSVLLEKQVTGAAGQDVVTIRARGEGADQSSAETQALAALNAQRRDRYGRDSAIPITGKSYSSGFPQTGNNGPGGPAGGVPFADNGKGQPITTIDLN